MGGKFTEPKVRESDILRQIRDWLRWHGWFVLRIQQGLGCHKGISDLVALKDGRVLWIECKAPGGRQSDYQRKFQAEVEEHGGEYVLARSIEDVEQYLRGAKAG